VVGVVKEIGVPFVAGARARTLRDQGESGLNVFLLDTTTAAAATSTTGILLLMLPLLA